MGKRDKWMEFLDTIGLSEEEKTIVSSKFQHKSFKAKEILLEEGENCSFIAFVLSGFLKIYKINNSGRYNVQYLAKSGDFITSISSFLNQEPTDKFIVSNTDSEVITIDKRRYDELVEELPSLGWKVLDAVIDQISNTLNERNTLISLKAKERYNYFLKSKSEFIKNIPMGDISSYLGIRQQSLSRIRKEA